MSVRTRAHTCAREPDGRDDDLRQRRSAQQLESPQGSTGTDQFLYDNEGNRVLQRSSTHSVSDTITFDGYSEVASAGEARRPPNTTVSLDSA